MYQESGPIVRALGFGPIFRCQTFHLEHRTNQDDGLTRKSVLLSAQKQVNSLAPEIRDLWSVQNHQKLTHNTDNSRWKGARDAGTYNKL